MLATCIRHGDLVIDYHADGSVQIVRQSNMTGLVLSVSEWDYLVRVQSLHDAPMAPPQRTDLEAVK
jgi:hypothetical protein